MRKKRNMKLADACSLVDNDLSDGAYWAMAHEIAGAEYGDAWEELLPDPTELADAMLAERSKT